MENFIEFNHASRRREIQLGTWFFLETKQTFTNCITVEWHWRYSVSILKSHCVWLVAWVLALSPNSCSKQQCNIVQSRDIAMLQQRKVDILRINTRQSLQSHIESAFSIRMGALHQRCRSQKLKENKVRLINLTEAKILFRFIHHSTNGNRNASFRDSAVSVVK